MFLPDFYVLLTTGVRRKFYHLSGWLTASPYVRSRVLTCLLFFLLALAVVYVERRVLSPRVGFVCVHTWENDIWGTETDVCVRSLKGGPVFEQTIVLMPLPFTQRKHSDER